MRRTGAPGALLAAAALAAASFPVSAGQAGPWVGVGVLDRLKAEGRVRVLVSRDADGAGAPPAGLETVRSLSGGKVLAGWTTAEGLARLAADGETRAVVLDRTVRPAGQVGTAQIGIDRLLVAGLTGTGRAIGFVDTGIDLFHPDFGATAKGGGRVVGGWNFADGNADLLDCDGHGTAVAGVAAGQQGVAPGASVVALKVFGSRGGCSTALASDVLAAVDWALERREALGLDVLNVSLADDQVWPGFCDAADPVSASVFSRARESGLAVVAASGNSGHPEALSWPACHADVISVGMVYSAGQGPTTWEGGAACTDAVTGPDVVPCASNGGAALSLLAPGVRWVAPKAGGGRWTSFSGTSAAAPAASGALLLARQFASFADPLLASDFLRMTGIPVTDTRSALATPRLDAGTAFVSTRPATGPCELVEPANGQPGALVCRADASFLAGNVSSITASLSLEHPRLSAVRASLTAPDGTTVRLVDGLDRQGSVFREVIGRTVESREPLSLLSGRPAAGGWTLRLEDDSGFADGRLTSWALLVEPETPQQAGVPGPFSELLPTVVRSTGRYGSFFSTDLVLFNPDEIPVHVALAYHPSGEPAGPGVAVSFRVPPRATRTLSDVVGNAFRSTGFGPVRITTSPNVVVASRTETTAPGGGSYGLLVPSVLPGSASGAGDPPVFLAPVFRPGRSRVNLGFAEVAGGAARVEVLVRNGSGSVKARYTVDLAPSASRQVDDVHEKASAPPDDGDLFEVRVVSGTGRVLSWAIAVDNGSNDGLLVGASVPRRDAILPAAARSPGLFGAFFRTELKLSNPSTTPANVRFSFYPSRGDSPRQLVLSLGAWETRLFPDVLGSLLDLPEESAGALRVTAVGEGAGLIASSRTYTESPGKSYGLAIGLLADAEAVAGDEVGLTFLSGTERTRTNLGFLETAGRKTTVLITLYDASGSTLATQEQTLAPFEALQWNDVFTQMGVPPCESASAVLRVVRGGAVLAHAIRVDNVTNDASFLPGRILTSPSATLRADR